MFQPSLHRASAHLPRLRPSLVLNVFVIDHEAKYGGGAATVRNRAPTTENLADFPQWPHFTAPRLQVSHPARSGRHDDQRTNAAYAALLRMLSQSRTEQMKRDRMR